MEKIDQFELDCEIKDFTLDELIGEDPMPDKSLNTPFLRAMANNIGKTCVITNEICSEKKGTFMLLAISYNNLDYFYKLKNNEEIIYESCCNGIQF